MTTMPEEWQRKENKKRLRGKLTEAVKSVKYKRPSSLGMSEVMRRDHVVRGNKQTHDRHRE